MSLDRKTYIANNMLWKLEDYMKKVGSWGNVARELGISIRTIHRWRERKRISNSYLRLLESMLKEKCPEIF